MRPDDYATPTERPAETSGPEEVRALTYAIVCARHAARGDQADADATVSRHAVSSVRARTGSTA
jgi:hypothetical protein